MSDSGSKMPPPPVWIYRTSLPIPQPVLFEDLVRNVDATTRASLQNITSLRSAYAGAVVADIATQSVNTATAYHPHLLGVLQALDSVSPEMVKRVKVLWTMPLNARVSVEVTSLRFDHAMILISLGLAHRARASELLRGCGLDVNSADYKAASAELSIAAGVFEYCSKQPLAAWAGMEGGNIVELNGAFHRAMVELSLMEAQCLAVRKGIVSGVGLGVINKVLSGVVDHADRCKQCLADVRRAFSWDIPSITSLQRYVAIFHQYTKTLLFHRLGSAAMEESAYGKCVGFGKQGVISPEVDGLLKDSKTISEMPSFLELVKPVFETAAKDFATWEKDNANIYYERVPPVGECPAPAPAFLSKVTPFAEPFAIPPQISFQQSGCLIM